MGAGSSTAPSESKGHELVNFILAQEWEDVKTLLDTHGKMIDFTMRDPEMNGTALIWAAALKHAGTVRKLLQLGADPNLQTSDGRSCMHTAAIGNADRLREKYSTDKKT